MLFVGECPDYKGTPFYIIFIEKNYIKTQNKCLYKAVQIRRLMI